MAIVERMPARAEQLALEPAVSAEARAGLRHGADLFDRGQFWDAHEAWEEIWQAEPRVIRSFYQGIIQVAAGLHHWTGKHNPRGVAIMLARGIEKLEWYTPAYLGIDVETLIRLARTALQQAQERDAAWLAAHAPEPVPRVPWLRREIP